MASPRQADGLSFSNLDWEVLDMRYSRYIPWISKRYTPDKTETCLRFTYYTSLVVTGALTHRLKPRTTFNTTLLAKSKMVTKGAPNGRWGHVNERSKQLLLNEFFDMRSRFIRKGCDNEKKREKKWDQLQCWPLVPKLCF